MIDKGEIKNGKTDGPRQGRLYDCVYYVSDNFTINVTIYHNKLWVRVYIKGGVWGAILCG
jgi:hypothetical protein